MPQPEIILYSTDYCPYCKYARQLLDKKGLQYKVIAVDTDPEKREEMVQKSGRMTVPQIFINDKPIGGYDDLYALETSGQLDNILNYKE